MEDDPVISRLQKLQDVGSHDDLVYTERTGTPYHTDGDYFHATDHRYHESDKR